jgi:beta-glucosidase
MAAVDGVMHGTDIECGTSVYYTLLDAVKNGLIKEQQLDISLRRLFAIRYRLGMFDPVEMVKFAHTPFPALEAPEHGAHALKMAKQSIVLLKNENSTLPLRKTIKKIAVLGPNADNRIAVLGNYNGNPSKVVSLLDGIREKIGGNVELIYEPAIDFTNDTMIVYEDATDQYSWEGHKGFKAEYFDNRELQGTPAAVTNETGIDHAWQEGQHVMEGISASNFSVRYTSNYTATKDGFFTFEVEADDGYRLFVNGNQVIDAWQRNRWGARTYKMATRKDTVYKLVLEYWQGEGKANVSLRGGNFKKTDFSAVANKVKDADVIIFAGGISPQLEGEEMPVNAPGFNGGDRTSVSLPAVQTELMKTLRSTGRPVVFVMMTGSAIAIPWEDENIPAIVNAWYGGQSAGAAIADVLFGDYNPAGRLPVTFYKSDTDLPSFSSYDMAGRTYRYFKGEALYPFGYGLSYSRFAYSELKAPFRFARNKSLTVTAMVRNIGPLDGEEVVELYISYPDVKEKAPIRSLKGFRRIFLKAGSGQLVTFTLSPEQLSLTNEKTGALYQPAGKMVLSIGGGQPGIKNKTTSNVISKDIFMQ